VGIRTALLLAFASDTVSITIMEIVDSVVVVLIPGATPWKAHVPHLHEIESEVRDRDPRGQRASEFEPEVASLAGVKIFRSPAQLKVLRFALAFVTKQTELDTLSALLSAKAEGDAILWFAYPKQSSRGTNVSSTETPVGHSRPSWI
jgi:hypothetical protein